VGVSFNKPEKNASWVTNQEFQYEVWSDSERSLAMMLGAATKADQGMPSRVTRVLDAEGRVVLSYDQVKVGSHPEQVLEDCRALFGR
jgi:peroxiredoxin